MDIWPQPLIGEILSCEIEPGNKHDINVVAAIRQGAVFGHVPMMLSEFFHKFLRLPGSKANVTVRGGSGQRCRLPSCPVIQKALHGPK